MFDLLKTIHNKGQEKLPIFIEPWGYSFDIPVGESCELIGRSQKDGTWEIEPVSDGIIFWAWDGAVFQLMYKGVVICESNVVFPSPPQGQSISSVLKLLLGKTEMPRSDKWYFEVL